MRFVSVIGHPNRSSSENMTIDALGKKYGCHRLMDIYGFETFTHQLPGGTDDIHSDISKPKHQSMVLHSKGRKYNLVATPLNSTHRPNGPN